MYAISVKSNLVRYSFIHAHIVIIISINCLIDNNSDRKQESYSIFKNKKKTLML